MRKSPFGFGAVAMMYKTTAIRPRRIAFYLYEIKYPNDFAVFSFSIDSTFTAVNNKVIAVPKNPTRIASTVRTDGDRDTDAVVRAALGLNSRHGIVIPTDKISGYDFSQENFLFFDELDCKVSVPFLVGRSGRNPDQLRI
jgi:hypothetical protein